MIGYFSKGPEYTFRVGTLKGVKSLGYFHICFYVLGFYSSLNVFK